MKRILRIALISFGACLGLAMLAGIFNAITGNRPAQPRPTVTAIAIGLISKPSSTAPVQPTIEPSVIPIEAATPVVVVTDIPITDAPTLAPATALPTVEGVFVSPQGDSVNIRSGPGTNYPIVGSLAAGQSAKLIGRLVDNSWVQIELGWVNTSVATITGTIDSVSVVEPPAAPISAPAPEATTVTAPIADVPTIAPAPVSNCDPAYPDVCIPSPPPDLDCPQLERFGEIKVVIHPDPHGLDSNDNGFACAGR